MPTARREEYNCGMKDTSAPATKQDLDDLFARMEDRFATKQDIEEFIAGSSNEILFAVSARFDQVDNRLDQMETRFNERFSQVETVLMRTDNKLNDSLERLSDHDAKMRIIQRKIA